MLRWYTTVVDCHDVAAQGRWWADVLGWRVHYEDDEEVVIAPEWMTDKYFDSTPWERMGQALVFVLVPESKTIKNRLHLDLAPHTSDDRDAEIQRLIDLGATRVDVGQTPDVTWEVLADPEGNEFCVLSSRDS